MAARRTIERDENTESEPKEREREREKDREIERDISRSVRNPNGRGSMRDAAKQTEIRHDECSRGGYSVHARHRLRDIRDGRQRRPSTFSIRPFFVFRLRHSPRESREN